MGTRISQFTALTAVASADYFPLVQDSDTTNKRVSLASLLASVPLGSAATPSIAFTGDLNTGIYSPGADQVAVATNGTGRLFVSSAGLVGVGINPPSYALDVKEIGTENLILNLRGRPSDNQAYIRFASNDNATANALIGIPEANTLNIFTNNTERLRITSAGLVGIGTSSPGALLHLNQSGTGDYSSIRFSNTGASGRAYEIGVGGNTSAAGYANNLYFYDSTGSALRMVLDSSGRLGIGTTSPSYALHVRSAVDYQGFFENTVTGTGALIGGISGAGIITSQGTATPLVFARGGTEAARIDASSRLLVGTSTSPSVGVPASALFVVQGYTGVPTGDSLISLQRGQAPASITSGAQLGAISFGANDGSPYAQIHAATDAAGAANDYPGRLVFSSTPSGSASPVERMRITSLGVLKQSTTGTYISTTARYNEFSNLNATSGDINTYFALGANTSDTSSVFIYCFQAGVGGKMIVYGNGDIQNANNAYGALSDIKLKENIVNANSQWNDIKALQVRNYNLKEGQTHTQIGLVAQEVELVSPGLVTESPDRDEDGNDLGTVTKSVNYSVLYMKAVKALQEAMERIETLEADVAQLKGA
jgi:hypothetical protein